MLTRQPEGESAHRGSIINIASLTSFIGGINVPAYAAAKGGIAQLTKALSNQWAAQGINVNAVCKTYLWTVMRDLLTADSDRTWLHSY